ncbi:MAG: DUF992 domain-containing protein [Planctomycetales bacterium]|nr:DUF992 domain-containing protein [Planctomycetales bacterium]
MMMKMQTSIDVVRCWLGAGICAALVALSPTSLMAQSNKVVAGTLTCKGKGTVGLILGSKQTLACSYNPAGKKNPKHAYTATITKLGLDIGIKGPSVMVWTVLGSTTELPGEALAGKYGGLSADASIGIGAGANTLIGGSKDSVVLQPLSVQGQTGINLAVGIAGLTLKLN